MSGQMLLKGFFAGIMSLAIMWSVYDRYDSQTGYELKGHEQQRYLPYVTGILPLYFGIIAALSLIILGIERTVAEMSEMMFGIFFEICVYYAILLLLMPYLRRKICSRSCALLWFLPNYMYFTQYSFMGLNKPALVICVPEKAVWLIFGLWVAGAMFVMAWKIVGHIIFRREILNGAVPVSDFSIIHILNREMERANFKGPWLKIVKSEKVASPLTIGLFKRSTKIVLPKRQYSADEMELIFRHEIIHIARADAWSKFFLVFCLAMCWFNPLMWSAVRKSADDMELSCDETVLLGCNNEEKQRYARLILSEAGEGRGFTTCLSASAEALRYRLKSIVQPVKTRSGAILVGLMLFAITMTCGFVTIASGESSGNEIFFQSKENGEYTLEKVYVQGGEYDGKDPIDKEAILEYLNSLTLSEIHGNYTFSDEDTAIEIKFEGPEGLFWISLRDRYAIITPLKGERGVYYLKENIDWEFFGDIVPEIPEARLKLYEDGNKGTNTLTADTAKLICLSGDGRTYIDRQIGPGEGRGIFGASPQKAEITFSFEVIESPEVLIEPYEGGEGYWAEISENDGIYSFVLPDYDAHYTVYTRLMGKDGRQYEAEFTFDIGDV